MENENEWDSYAEGWDSDEGARAYASSAFVSLQGVLAAADIQLDGARVIDFGCGTGILTERLVGSGASVVAIDTSRAMLAVLDEKVRRQGWTAVQTATELPDTPSACDLVVCSSVCGFLDDYPGTAAELVAHLRPGGAFVQWDWERGDGDEHGLSRSEIGDALEAAGLEQIVVDIGFVATIGGETMRPLMGHGRRPS